LADTDVQHDLEIHLIISAPLMICTCCDLKIFSCTCCGCTVAVIGRLELAVGFSRSLRFAVMSDGEP